MRKIISEYTKCTLVDMLNKVLEHIAVKYENVCEGCILACKSHRG